MEPMAWQSSAASYVFVKALYPEFFGRRRIAEGSRFCCGWSDMSKVRNAGMTESKKEPVSHREGRDTGGRLGRARLPAASGLAGGC